MLWKCSICTFVHEGDNPPETCPKCGAPSEKFTALSDEEAQKIYASDRTNDIHMEIINLAMAIAELSEEGIDIDLDPPCVSAFQKAKQEAWTMKQRCKAEIAGHMSRGKW